MAMRKVRFVGLNKDVWIPDDIEVIVDIVPSRFTNIRSNQVFSGQTKTTWHDTGNPSSDARGERNYLHSGAGGRYVGYNFAFDAKRIIQLTPLNEVTWHAGTPDGNKFSWGAEQCLNTDWNGALRAGAALHGGLCAAMGWNVDTALVQHNYWTGKHCPAQIRNKGQWNTVVNMVKAAKEAAVKAAGGDTSGGGGVVEEYPKGTVVMVGDKPWDGLSDVEYKGYQYYGDAGTASVNDGPLNRRTLAKTSAPLTGPALPNGEQFAVLGYTIGDEVGGENRWWVTPWGSHIWVGGTAEKPTVRQEPEQPEEPEEPEQPEEPQEPQEPEFDINKLRVIVGERVYYPAGVDENGREVVLVNNADIYKKATFSAEKVGMLEKDARVVAKYWCHGDTEDLEDLWWILDAAGDDEINIGPRLHVTDTYQRPF